MCVTNSMPASSAVTMALRPGSGSWVEANDDGTSTGGTVRVDGARLRVDNSDGGTMEYISRSADLSGATSATLSFDYDGYGAGGLDTVVIEVSDNGGATFTALELLDVVGNISGSRSYNLTDSISPDDQFRLRFRLNQGSCGRRAVCGLRQRGHQL